MYQCTTFPSVPLAPFANSLMMGVWLQNDLTDVPLLRPAQDAGSEEWMWWEGAGWAGVAFGWNPDDQQFAEVERAPADGGYRDIKAHASARQTAACGWPPRAIPPGATRRTTG